MNWKKILVILLGCVLVVGGLYCLFTPIQTFLATGYVIGVLILCDAVASIIAWFDVRQYVQISIWYLLGAIVSLIFGVLIISKGTLQLAVDLAVIYMIAAWIIVIAIPRIVLAVRIKKVSDVLPNAFKNNRWIGLMISSVLMIIFACLCAARPDITSVMLGILIAWNIIFNGVSLITLGSYIQTPAKA